MIPIEDNQNNENNPNVVKDKAKQIVKKMAKRIGRKLLVILLPITIVLVLISAITWFVFMDEGTWNDKEKGNPSTYTKNVKISPTDGITTDKMEIIKKALSALGYTDERIEEMDEAEIIKILQISQKLNRVVTKIDDCTVGELLWCVNNEYSKYLKKPEDLEYLLNAEVVTQYPNIDGLSDDKLNGIIKFARLGDNSDTNGDGVVNIYDIVDIESIRNRADIVNIQDAKEKNRKLKEEINKQIEASSFVLKYISESEFDTKFNNYINTGNKDVFNYFTIDDQENVIVATWSEEHGEFSSNNTALQNRKKIKAGHTESTIQSEYDSRYKVTSNSTDNISAEYITYTATKTPINYKAYVQKYTLPFEYLWSLLVMGESDDFVLSLAELAYESQMVVGIYDSITTTIDVRTHDYTENFREKEIETESPGGTTSTPWREEKYSYTDIDTVTTKYDNIQFNIMYANTWFVDVILDYKRDHIEEPPSITDTAVPDEDWSDNGSYTTHSSYTVGGVDPVTGEDDSETIHVTIEHIKEKKTTAQSYTTQQTMIYDRYEKVKTEVKGKDDINPNTDLNFVKLLRADQNANALLFKPINVVWLCDMLAQNTDTVDMVELTEYLINKAKNPDDTSLSFDFGIFEPSAIGGFSGIFGSSVEDKVWYTLRNLGYSEYAVAGVMGNIYAESGFNPEIIEHGSGVGFGLCQWSYGRRTQLEAYAEAKGVSPSDVDTQIEFLIAELTPGGGAGGHANYQLMTTEYNGQKYRPSDWKDATNASDAATAFCYTFERPKASSARIDVRTQKAEQYYEMYKGKTIESDANEIQLKIVEIAQNSSAYGIAARGGYCLAWVNSVYEAAGAKTERKDCAYCSGYYFGVSKDFSNIPLGAAVYGESNTTAGKIYGHVGIYIGNGKVADNIGGVRITTLSSWLASYPNGCWGWTSSTPVNSAYPVTQGLIHAGRH